MKRTAWSILGTATVVYKRRVDLVAFCSDRLVAGMYICRLSPYEGAYSGDSSTLNRVPMLAGIPVTDDDTDTLVEFLRHAEFPGVADKLERALASEVKIVTLERDSC